ncbi:hypothetical protein HN51_016875 [Arachis hypogaea]|uniref:Late embryogenesis abundant protein n=1 Tax=Arachis hypogaea TaxID=3818 RepID=A0A445CUX6_ARAHY|nr:uncharacterized protein LOC112697365 [Arachis hypogaea]QHO47498.1 Late embryogenesis abundant protein [Arachis hypogaea]RYR54740.1 hypothetical protein Ahy_A06g030026 [Arachis hypogaea]
MQAIKEKIQDIKESRKAKAELKAEEKAEKELAKARMDIAHEARLAKEAEAEMDRHVAKASEIAEKEITKHQANKSNPMDMSGMDDGAPPAFDGGISNRSNAGTLGSPEISDPCPAPPALAETKSDRYFTPAETAPSAAAMEGRNAIDRHL